MATGTLRSVQLVLLRNPTGKVARPKLIRRAKFGGDTQKGRLLSLSHYSRKNPVGSSRAKTEYLREPDFFDPLRFGRG